MSTKVLLESIRTADGGKVEYSVSTPEGTILTGTIEESFFEEFMGIPQPNLKPERKVSIIRDNIPWLEAETERQFQQGNRRLVIS